MIKKSLYLIFLLASSVYARDAMEILDQKAYELRELRKENYYLRQLEQHNNKLELAYDITTILDGRASKISQTRYASENDRLKILGMMMQNEYVLFSDDFSFDDKQLSQNYLQHLAAYDMMKRGVQAVKENPLLGIKRQYLINQLMSKKNETAQKLELLQKTLNRPDIKPILDKAPGVDEDKEVTIQHPDGENEKITIQDLRAAKNIVSYWDTMLSLTTKTALKILFPKEFFKAIAPYAYGFTDVYNQDKWTTAIGAVAQSSNEFHPPLFIPAYVKEITFERKNFPHINTLKDVFEVTATQIYNTDQMYHNFPSAQTHYYRVSRAGLEKIEQPDEVFELKNKELKEIFLNNLTSLQIPPVEVPINWNMPAPIFPQQNLPPFQPDFQVYGRQNQTEHYQPLESVTDNTAHYFHENNEYDESQILRLNLLHKGIKNLLNNQYPAFFNYWEEMLPLLKDNIWHIEKYIKEKNTKTLLEFANELVKNGQNTQRIGEFLQAYSVYCAFPHVVEENWDNLKNKNTVNHHDLNPINQKNLLWHYVKPILSAYNLKRPWDLNDFSKHIGVIRFLQGKLPANHISLPKLDELCLEWGVVPPENN